MQGKKLAATGIEFHSSSGVGHISIPWRRRSLIVCSPTWTTETGPRGFLRRHHLLHKTHHDATPRIEQIILASLRAYQAGAAEMELMESRRHRGARAGVFGEAARGREIVQVRASIPPTSSPLQPGRHAPGRAAADRFANACRAAFAETAPKGRCSRRASS